MKKTKTKTIREQLLPEPNLTADQKQSVIRLATHILRMHDTFQLEDVIKLGQRGNECFANNRPLLESWARFWIETAQRNGAIKKVEPSAYDADTYQVLMTM